MRRLLWAGVLVACKAFALDVEQLPVWNPDSLFRDSVPVAVDSARPVQSLETHGYKTMQVTVGDDDTQVDQQLRLSITGMIGDSVEIDALLSDVDRKAGDQTTATLQEVDQVYFKATSRHWMLHLGDLTWQDSDLGLFSVERTTLGGMVGFRTNLSEVRAVAGTDGVQRISRTFAGVSGQREGYSLSGDGSFISVVPQSESVWINGEKLSRGKDYEVNYAGGLLNFRGTRMPHPEDEIRVEYDAYEADNVMGLYGVAGAFRHPNLYLDLSGFRLEHDVDRLKKGLWSDDDYKMLKSDDGDEFVRDDSLGELHRPMRTEMAGARIRLQGMHRYFADFELAASRRDSNTVSEEVNGPSGRAFRWFLTTDSSAAMRALPVAFSAYGNYVAERFDFSGFQGGDNDWNSYKLKDEWDLDSALLANGSYRHDEFALRFRLGAGWFGNVAWGYRQGDFERWNSSRVKGELTRNVQGHATELSLIHVQSQTEAAGERFQGYFSEKWERGFVRPFAGSDVRYTERDSAGLVDEEFSLRANAGISLVKDSWNVREAAEFWNVDRRGDSYGEEWNDSLRQVRWNQSAEIHLKQIELTHFLQYEYRDLAESGDENSWAGDLAGRFGDEKAGIHGTVSYKLGLTEEQTYTPVYKAVAKGTGDVRYDSLTGAFIEGVDNGDFVYEGMGRNDSIGAVLASNSGFTASMEMWPGRLFGVNSGILRDIKLSGSFNALSEDTTGRKLYFPALLPSALHRVSSGALSWSGNVEWEHPSGALAVYRPSANFDKKLSSIEYYESVFRHEAEIGYKINEDHYMGLTGFVESDELDALQDLEWDIRSVSGKYRFHFLDGFSLEPGGRYRYGAGEESTGREFDAYLWEASLRFGYRRINTFDGFVRFSYVQVETGDDVVPYQMMSGYSDGNTFRLEASASLSVNKNISFGLHYVLRFGDSEENVFQKLSTEARAVF
ncbi:hypothetical protein [uncultured Fibrobacter sp.]|uniref:hypothetical protein n=1 Tax=uncultured Fibrobacter sp. TaxID=261512 RepID=UPI0025DA8DFD|nr:hypothetical protein [uncultured Fibrobacter sp.]